MLKLEKITTLYSQDEDRVSLNAMDATGGTVRIWLTQRILLRLISELIKVIKPKHEDKSYVAVMAGISHQRAVDQQEPGDPVKLDCASQEWLVKKIDMKIGQGGVILALSSQNGEAAKLVLELQLLRQWLGILKGTFEAAQWNFDWPEWMMPSKPKASPSRALH